MAAASPWFGSKSTRGSDPCHGLPRATRAPFHCWRKVYGNRWWWWMSSTGWRMGLHTHTPLIGISSTCETVQTSSFGGRVLCLGSVLFLKYYTCTIQKPSDILRNTSPLNQLGSTLVAFHARDRRRRPSTNTMRMLEYLGHIQSPDAAVASC